MSNFIVQALRGQPITVFGEGQQTRSFCYVDDLVLGLRAMMETGSEVVGPVNLGNPSEFTIRQLAELVVDLSGSRSRLVYEPLPVDDPRQTTAKHRIGRAFARLASNMPLREGLLKTIAYFEKLLSTDGAI